MSIIRESHIRYGTAHRSYLTRTGWLFLVALVAVVLIAIYGPELFRQVREACPQLPGEVCS